MRKFPKFIHVTIENDGQGDDEVFNVFRGKAIDALTSTDKTQVATYELKVVQEGKLEPVFSTEVG